MFYSRVKLIWALRVSDKIVNGESETERRCVLRIWTF